MKSFQDEHEKNLPDTYRKDKESNNYKILQVEKYAVNDFRKSLREIADILDFNNATGKTLDLYGARVGQPRGVATDEQYILMIKAKIMQNMSNGTHKSVLEGICFTLNCEPSQVIIKDGKDPCTVEIVSLPLDVIVGAGMSASQVVSLFKKMLPVGTKLESYLFTGTFEFSESETDYDETKGFCDVEGGTIGGYLGVSDDSGSVLPI